MPENTSLNLLHRGIPQGALGAVLGVLFTALMQLRGMVPGGLVVLMLGGVGFGVLAWGISRAVLGAAGGAAGTLYMPDGASTAYVPQFSQIEALEARGDLQGAADAWDAACAADPGNATLLIRAADFRLRALRDPVAARDRYRRARNLESADAEVVRYCTSKLVDLYLGPLGDEGRALVELRRLVDGHPGTPEAEHARAALQRLKASRAGEG